MPTLAVLVGILVNNSRLSDVRKHVESRLSDIQRDMDARFAGIYRQFDAERRVNEANCKMILDKIDDIDNRLARLEERFAR